MHVFAEQGTLTNKYKLSVMVSKKQTSKTLKSSFYFQTVSVDCRIENQGTGSLCIDVYPAAELILQCQVNTSVCIAILLC